MENSFLNNLNNNSEASNEPKPEKEKSNNERTPEEQKEHLQNLSEIVTLTGFIETEELKGLRSDVGAWAEKAQEIVDQAGKDNLLRKKLFIGYHIQLAALYYEDRDPVAYFENIDQALAHADYLRLEDIADRIEALG